MKHPAVRYKAGWSPALHSQHNAATPAARALCACYPAVLSVPVSTPAPCLEAQRACRVMTCPVRPHPFPPICTNLCLHKHHAGPPFFLKCDVVGVCSSTCSPQEGLLMQTALAVTLQQPGPQSVSHASAGDVCTRKYAATMTSVPGAAMMNYTSASASHSYQALCNDRLGQSLTQCSARAKVGRFAVHQSLATEGLPQQLDHLVRQEWWAMPGSDLGCLLCVRPHLHSA